MAMRVPLSLRGAALSALLASLSVVLSSSSLWLPPFPFGSVLRVSGAPSADFPLKSYPVLSGSSGVPISDTLFPQSASSEYSSFCPMPVNTGCHPVTRTRSCLSRSEIASALSSQPAILASLQARFNVRIVLQTLESPISSTHLEILRILLSEVMGYSTTVRQDQTFAGELASCARHDFDLHNLVWRSNVKDSVWNAALQVTGEGGCTDAGTSGFIGANVWVADKKTADATTATPGAVPTDYHGAYASQQGVIGLPRLNWTHIRTQYRSVEWSWGVFGWVPSTPSQSNLWLDPLSGIDGVAPPSDTGRYGADQFDVHFVPPLCQNDALICGVAYVYDYLFSRGWAAQQVTNLKWRVGLQFSANFQSDWARHKAHVAELLARGEQVLFMSTRTVPDESANSEDVVKVLLPEITAACLEDPENERGDQGIGSVACNFIQENTYKAAYDSLDTDKQDAIRLLQTMLVDHAKFSNYVRAFYQGVSLADLACTWVKHNTVTWSSWLQVQTPLKHTIDLSTGALPNVIYAFSALFLLIGCVCNAFLFWHRGHPVVRRSSHVFCQLIVLGSALFPVALIVAMRPSTQTTCVVNQFLLSVGFSLFYGSLLVKTWRIDKIFASAKLQKLTLPDSLLMRHLACYAAADLLLIILWAAISPPTPTLIAHTAEDYAFVTECSSRQSDSFRIAVYLLRGLSLLLGAAFAVRARDVQDAYNESKFLAGVTYNIVVVTAVVVGIELVASNDPQVRAVSWLIGVALAVHLSVVIFVGSKASIILGKKGPAIVQAEMATVKGSSGGTGGSGGKYKTGTAVAADSQAPLSSHDDRPILHSSNAAGLLSGYRPSEAAEEPPLSSMMPARMAPSHAPMSTMGGPAAARAILSPKTPASPSLGNAAGAGSPTAGQHQPMRSMQLPPSGMASAAAPAPMPPAASDDGMRMTDADNDAHTLPGQMV